MPGKRITKKQVDIYMQRRKSGDTQALAAAKADFSKRSGSTIDNKRHWSQKMNHKKWKTRKDPFEGVWESDIEPLLVDGIYESTFILNELQKRYPDRFSGKVLRTLQRRVKHWRAMHGPPKEVMFRQLHQPGSLGVSDFTHPKDIEVTINGIPFEHILYHFRLPYSGLNYVQVFAGSGESFTALAQGLSEALHFVGGAPKIHRTDSLSASFKNISKEAKDDLTERYKSLVQSYGMEATRINPGKGHENGTIESSHRHLKNRIRQSLILRGRNDFSSLQEYRDFIQDVVKQHNKHNAKNIAVEKANLQRLPDNPPVIYTETTAVVSSTSTIEVRRVTYSVPSRLIGEKLHVRIYEDRLECYVGASHALTLHRAQIPPRGKRARVINYRHVIDSLIKKPGAFRSCRFRDDLLPNENYRKIWEYAKQTMMPKEADKFIISVLHLAAKEDCQDDLEHEILNLIKAGKKLKLSNLRTKFTKQKNAPIALNIPQHSLSSYNTLIPCAGGEL